MRRNKKFYQEKELLRLDREESKFFDRRRDERKRKIKSGVGWRRDLSKKLCPKGIYKDLKIVIDMMAEVFREVEPVREYYRWYGLAPDFHGLVYRRDPMLRELSQSQYDSLSAASKGYLCIRKHYYIDRRTGEEKIYNTFALKERYFHYLYTRLAPMYINYYLGYWNWNDPEYEYLRNKIERNHLRPKICKAKSKSYYRGFRYDEEWRQHKAKVAAKKQMEQDIADYYDEKEGVITSPFSRMVEFKP